MNLTNNKGGGGGSSFLPEDYVQRKAERRQNFIALSLFCVVMFGVVGAFFVTNRQWSAVKAEQRRINVEYTAEAKKIDDLKQLEAQKVEMMEKAEITAALLERVPRSILMAELINRMPEQLTLTDFKLTGKRVREAAPQVNPKDRFKPKARSLAGGKPGDAKAEAEPKPKPPRFDFTMEITGLAAGDNHVADYHASLKQCQLLSAVDLMSSVEVLVDNVGRRKFRIEATIRPTADARNIEPLHVPRDGLRAASLLGPDGKPTPQPPSWLKRMGLTAGKVPQAALPEDVNGEGSETSTAGVDTQEDGR